MTLAAKFPVYDIRHENVVGPGSHFKANFCVTHFALKTNAMKPMRKNYRAHAVFFRPIVKYHIAVFGTRQRRRKQRQQSQQDNPEKHVVSAM